MREIEAALFRDMTREEMEEMSARGALRERAFSRGETILRAGERVRELGLVLSGLVHIESVDYWGNRSILGAAAPGEIFAESYAVCGESLMVSAVAAEDTRVLFADLERLLAPENAARPWHGKLLHALTRLCARKNLALSSRIFSTTPKTVRGRLLTFLSEQAVKNGGTEFSVPFDRQQMADYLNLDRSALSKELGKMRDEGLLEFRKNRFRLLGASRWQRET